MVLFHPVELEFQASQVGTGVRRFDEVRGKPDVTIYVLDEPHFVEFCIRLPDAPPPDLVLGTCFRGLIVVPLRAMLRSDWWETLEHEMLHVEFPDWPEWLVIALARTFSMAEQKV